MKKQTSRISRIAFCLLLSVSISGILCPPRVSGQDGSKFTKPGDVWHVAYTITIKGNGTEEPELGSDGPVIKWIVNRTYSGTADLDVGKYPIASSERVRDEYKKKLLEPKLSFSSSMIQKARIDDSMVKEYDPTCEEYDITTETWEADSESGNPFGHAYLWINNTDLTHDLIFPVRIQQVKLSIIKMFKDRPFSVIYNRKTVHYPKNEVEVIKPEVQTNAKNIQIPQVEGWLEGGELVRKNKLLSQEATGSFTVDSGELPVNETVLPGVNTSGKVKIQIKYSLTLEH